MAAEASWVEGSRSAEVTSEHESSFFVECRHGLPAICYTSWTWQNPGRRFYRCAVWEHDDCDFFKWYDPTINRYYKELLFTTLQEKKQLKKEVQRCRDNEIRLKMKLKEAEDNIYKLKANNDRLGIKLSDISRKEKESFLGKKLKCGKSMTAFVLMVIAIGLFKYRDCLNIEIVCKEKLQQ